MLHAIELRALVCAVAAALLALSSAWLAARGIQALPHATESAYAPDITSTPELIAQGRKFFGESCSHCHGDDAAGDEGPDLHHLAISNERIAATIKKGVKGEMPTFAKKYDDRQVAALVSYLRSLR